MYRPAKGFLRCHKLCYRIFSIKLLMPLYEKTYLRKIFTRLDIVIVALRSHPWRNNGCQRWQPMMQRQRSRRLLKSCMVLPAPCRPGSINSSLLQRMRRSVPVSGSARPQDLRLTTEEAYTFLRQSVPLLEQSGFGVLVPSWWQKPAARLKVKLKVKPKEDAKTGAGLMGFDSIVTYDWMVAVGNTTLSEKEFEKLVKLKMPLIQVRGQWIELRPEEIEAAIAFFEKKRGNGDMRLGEALRLGLGQEQSAVGLQVIDIEGEGWIKELMDRLSNSTKIASIKPPANFQGK